ncbi:hypothetical protein [Buchnera aphidicola]|nr:hypothetical protein [Buchnera aphidicola (Stegophylla sp.)]
MKKFNKIIQICYNIDKKYHKNCPTIIHKDNNIHLHYNNKILTILVTIES